MSYLATNYSEIDIGSWSKYKIWSTFKRKKIKSRMLAFDHPNICRITMWIINLYFSNYHRLLTPVLGYSTLLLGRVCMPTLHTTHDLVLSRHYVWNVGINALVLLVSVTAVIWVEQNVSTILMFVPISCENFSDITDMINLIKNLWNKTKWL